MLLITNIGRHELVGETTAQHEHTTIFYSYLPYVVWVLSPFLLGILHTNTILIVETPIRADEVEWRQGALVGPAGG